MTDVMERPDVVAKSQNGGSPRAKVADKRAGLAVKAKQGLIYRRAFAPGEDPFADVEVGLRDVVLTNARTGKTSFEQRDITAPLDWDQQSLDIFAQHYLRGQLDTADRETSVMQSIDRIVDEQVRWAQEGRTDFYGKHLFIKKLFADDESAMQWGQDLKWLLIHKYVVFNSPVWYNIGVAGVPQQASACFINSSDLDGMEKIVDWYRTEVRIFKGGSGSGINVSAIRSSYEGITGGGRASGPCSYMRAADASAGTMASGGRSRRAAKMVVMDDDHPDILEQSNGAPGFIKLKSRAEDIARTLRDAGFDMGVDSGHDAINVQYQNANNSVRFSDAFMVALREGGNWQTRARRPELVWKTIPSYKAKDLWRAMAQASWECGDPGVQFHDVINGWNTTPAAGSITASNPCSEYMSLDASPCNLANLNLIKFLRPDRSWDSEGFMAACRVLAIAQTVLAAYADYPTEEIADTARGFRQIGQGYTNLGAIFMLLGLPYDSDEARAWAGVVTAQLQASVGVTSSHIASRWGTYGGVPERNLPGFDDPVNRAAHLRVVQMHLDYLRAVQKAPTAAAKNRSASVGDETRIELYHREVVGAGHPLKSSQNLKQAFQDAVSQMTEALRLGEEVGYASSYWSNIPPMGTSGIVLEQDTSGLEPGYMLQVTKKKVSGDWMTMANRQVVPALLGLGYTAQEAEAIAEYVTEHNSVVGAPKFLEEHYAVFDMANLEPVSGRYLSVLAHIKMLAAVQAQLSGASSKTINLPNQATVQDFETAHYDLWRFGVKAGALYRDGSKATQPLSAKEGEELAGPPPTVRKKLPRQVDSKRFKIAIPQPGLDDFEVYVTAGVYPNGQLGELFAMAGNEGTEINGLFAMAMKWGSLGFQHGVPAASAIKMWLGMKFEPSGMLSPAHSAFTSCTSPADLIAKELALIVLSDEERHALSIFTRDERTQMNEGHELPPPAPAPVVQLAEAAHLVKPLVTLMGDMPICNAPTCGGIRMSIKNGACWVCPNCGNSSGCS